MYPTCKCGCSIHVLHPLLIRAMKWVAILSTSEAEACLRDYNEGRDYSGEAVNHFGGTKAVIQRAWDVRHTVREVWQMEAK